MQQAKPAKKHWKGTTKEAMRLRCPHCGWPCVIRSSEEMSVLTRKAQFHCANAECGHVFVALTEIAYTLTMSSTPNPSVKLPISEHVRRDVLVQMLQAAPSAPHPTQQTQPVNRDLFVGPVPQGPPPKPPKPPMG